MEIKIKEVNSLKDLKRFINFPFKLYSENKYWVPPLIFDEIKNLRADKNPAFEFCKAKYWLAYKNGEIAGRIAGIINERYIEKWKNKYARFGWVDFIDDKTVSDALFNTFEKWAADNGMTAVHGPLGFTDLDYEGMLIEGFEELGTLATIYNYPYYPVHLENRGYIKDVDWVEYEVKVPEIFPEKIKRIADIVLRKYKLHILNIKKAKDLLPYGKDLFNVLNSAYNELYGVVHLTEKQIDMYIKQYFSFIRTDFVPVILDREGKIAGFAITVPSLSIALQKSKGKLFPLGFLRILRSMRKNDLVDFYLIGVRPDLQGKGINALLIFELYKTYNKYKILRAETNPELEDNRKIREQWKFFENRQHKRRRCFIKQLDNNI
ncbi:hypothetical protein ACFL4T_05100 [candidate division KSB1 bacterium]